MRTLKEVTYSTAKANRAKLKAGDAKAKVEAVIDTTLDGEPVDIGPLLAIKRKTVLALEPAAIVDILRLL